MDAAWKQTVIVSGMPDVPTFQLHCEPESATHEVLAGDVLTITFEAAAPHAFEISPVADGLVLCRYGDSDVTIDDERGRPLSW